MTAIVNLNKEEEIMMMMMIIIIMVKNIKLKTMKIIINENLINQITAVIIIYKKVKFLL